MKACIIATIKADRSFSLLTITSNRDSHLAHVVNGVNAMDLRPTEIVVVYMNQPVHPALDSDVPVRSIDLTTKSAMPLAQARNTAANVAKEELLIFLDVDCIPATDFASTLIESHDNHGGLVMGTPYYLPPESLAFDDARPHRLRESLPFGPQDNFNLFWSLCFAISKADFNRAGGFDESFVGYGAEDTDFAWSIKKAGLSFSLSPAAAYHQHHHSYRPPLNHFDDIIANARTFRAKWGAWTMDRWLEAFANRDLIEWNEDANTITVLRPPTEDEISAALVDQI